MEIGSVLVTLIVKCVLQFGHHQRHGSVGHAYTHWPSAVGSAHLTASYSSLQQTGCEAL